MLIAMWLVHGYTRHHVLNLETHQVNMMLTALQTRFYSKKQSCLAAVQASHIRITRVTVTFISEEIICLCYPEELVIMQQTHHTKYPETIYPVAKYQMYLWLCSTIHQAYALQSTHQTDQILSAEHSPDRPDPLCLLRETRGC